MHAHPVQETTIDPNAYLPRNSSSVSSIRHDVLPRTQRPSFGSSRGSSLRSSDGGDLLAAAMAAPAAPRTARMASTGGRHEHDDRLQRLVKDSDALKQLHSCLEEQLEGLKVRTQAWLLQCLSHSRVTGARCQTASESCG